MNGNDLRMAFPKTVDLTWGYQIELNHNEMKFVLAGGSEHQP